MGRDLFPRDSPQLARPAPPRFDRVLSEYMNAKRPVLCSLRVRPHLLRGDPVENGRGQSRGWVFIPMLQGDETL